MPAPPVPEPDHRAGGPAPAGREWLRWYTCVASSARHASWGRLPRPPRRVAGAAPRAAPGPRTASG